MKKSKRLKPIIRLAESTEQHAATELGRSQDQLQEQINRLQDLLDYRQEYRARFEQTGRSGASINALNSLRSFLEKLETAVEQQKQAVQTAENVVLCCKRQWFASRDKLKIYNNVAGKYISAESKQQEQQEQQDSDERAQRIR